MFQHRQPSSRSCLTFESRVVVIHRPQCVGTTRSEQSFHHGDVPEKNIFECISYVSIAYYYYNGMLGFVDIAFTFLRVEEVINDGTCHLKQLRSQRSALRPPREYLLIENPRNVPSNTQCVDKDPSKSGDTDER